MSRYEFLTNHEFLAKARMPGTPEADVVRLADDLRREKKAAIKRLEATKKKLEECQKQRDVGAPLKALADSGGGTRRRRRSRSSRRRRSLRSRRSRGGRSRRRGRKKRRRRSRRRQRK
jgi:hypothetical protein